MLRPISVKAATRFVRDHHRRLPRIQGALWAVAVYSDDGELVGVAMVGWPARVWMEDGVLAVLRVAVRDGQPNACSMLYGACSRAAKAMGATDLVTYTHADETGGSLVASGWWDGGDVARDYYVARSSRGTRYWIFRERREPRRWFVHGLFA